MHKDRYFPKSISLLTLVLGLLVGVLTACASSGQAAPTAQAPTSLPAQEPASTAIPTPAALSEDLLKNTSFTLPDIGEVRLKDGHFEQKYGEGATQVNRVDLQKEAVGDLNNDGVADAAVILAVNTGGTGVFIYLVVLTNQDGIPVQAVTKKLGDRVQVQTLAIQDEQIQMNSLGFGPDDPMCCPSQQATRTYAYANGDLKLLNESSVTATPHG